MHASTGTVIVPQIEVLVIEPLIASTLNRWRTIVDDAAAMRPTHLVIDLAGCDGLDAAGIDLLVDVHRRVWADGGRLTLRGLSGRLYRLLAIARVDHVLQTADAPAGYDAKHRADRRRNAAAATYREPVTGRDEVRWWESAAG